MHPFSPRWIGAAAVLTGLASAPADASIFDSAGYRVEGTVIVWSADGTAATPIVSDFVIDTGSGTRAATSGDIDLIADHVHSVVTGTLVPADEDFANTQGAPMVIRQIPGRGNLQTDSDRDRAMDAADSFSAFRIGPATDSTTRRMELFTSFYVASNVPFAIDAIATPVGDTTPAQMNRMRAYLDGVTLTGTDDGISFGSAAQFPHSAGSVGGRNMNGRTFTNLLTSRPVFRGDQRTAASRGTLAQQSVRFDIRYRYNTGEVDLADGVFDAEAEIIYTVFIP